MYGRDDRHGRGSGMDEGPCMVEVTDMEEGQAWMRAIHDGRGDIHGRGSGIDEGPCMVEMTDTEEGQAWMRGQA